MKMKEMPSSLTSLELDSRIHYDDSADTVPISLTIA